MRIRTYLVDDEKPARERLRQLLISFEEVEIVGEAADGEEAIPDIRRLQPDLVFLDIQMPGRNGLEVSASLMAPRPNVVFCTAFDEYAIRAFELHALDYLLKPVGRARLAQTVDRIRKLLSEGRELRLDLKGAQKVQEHMFPNVSPQAETLDYAGASIPAQTIGGDYYDFFQISPRKLAIAVADVAGKGIAAGLLMAWLQGRLQSQARRFANDLPGLLQELNSDIWRTTQGSRFITMFYSVYDDETRKLTYVNAGHNPPLVYSGTDVGTPRTLQRGGLLLGCFQGIVFEQETVALAPGDTIVAFSDGVIEACNSRGEEFGEARLASVVKSKQNASARELKDCLLEQVAAFSAGNPAEDDRTVVVAKVAK